MQGRKVMVLGVTGFIGLPLALRLAQGNEVHGLGLIGDQQSRAALADAGVRVWERDVIADGLSGVPRKYDHVFGLLAVTKAAAERSPTAAHRVNVDFVRDAIAHFAGSGGLVLGSTGNVYRPDAAPLSEDSPLGPREIYGLTKACGDLVAAFEAERAALPLCILRYFLPYGPGDRKLLPLFNAVRQGKVIAEDPETLLNPLHISDAVAMTISATRLCALPPRTLNVGGREVVTRRELATMLGKLVGREPVFAEPPPATPPGRVSDGVLQQRLLPAPTVSLREGLAEFVRVELAGAASDPPD